MTLLSASLFLTKVLHRCQYPCGYAEKERHSGEPWQSLFLTKLSGAVALKTAAYHHVLQKTVTTPKILTSGS